MGQNRAKKWVLGLIGGGVVLLIGAYLTLLYVQTSFLKNTLLPKAITYVEANYPAKIQLGDIQLSIFRGLVLKKLKLQLNTETATIEAAVEEVGVRYSLWSLLSDRFVIQSIQVDDVRIETNAHIKKSNEPAKPMPSISELKKQFEKAIADIPKGVEISEIDIQPITLLARVRTDQQEVSAELHHLQLQAGIMLVPGSLQVKAVANLPEEVNSRAQRISVKFLPPSKSPTLELQPSAKVQVDFTDTLLALEFSLLPFRKLDAFQIEIADFISGKLSLAVQEKDRIVMDCEVDLPQIRRDQVVFAGGKFSHKAGVEILPHLRMEHLLSLKSEGVKTGFEAQTPVALFEDGLEFEGDIRYDDKRGVDIKKLNVNNASGSFHSEVAGRFTTNLKELSVGGELRVLANKSGDGKNTVKATGSMTLPWRVTRTGDGVIGLRGTLDTQNFSARSDQFSLDGFTAKIPLEIQLLWRGGLDLGFASVITRNPFERVDYSGIRPYVTNFNSNLKVKKLKVQNYEVGPIFADVVVRQNYLIAEQYQMSLLDGVAAGHVFVDLWEKRRRLGFLGRVAGLNPKLLTRAPPTARDKRISSRVAVIFDLNKSLAEGRLDVTEIGPEQLKSLMEVLDPHYKDSKLNLARSLLKVGYPEYVGVRMSQGFMDMSVDLGGVVSISDLGIEGVPLTPVISRMKEQFLETIAKRTQR